MFEKLAEQFEQDVNTRYREKLAELEKDAISNGKRIGASVSRLLNTLGNNRIIKRNRQAIQNYMSGAGNGELESIKNVGRRTKAIEDFPRHQYGHLANVTNTNAAMQAVNQLNSVLGNPISDNAIFNGMLRLGFF